MKNLYIDTRILDDLNRKSHFLSEEIMMENAAAALEKHIENYFTNSKIQKIPCAIILCGGGNNGADGYALSRRLSGKYKILNIIIPQDFPLCKEICAGIFGNCICFRRAGGGGKGTAG